MHMESSGPYTKCLAIPLFLSRSKLKDFQFPINKVQAQLLGKKEKCTVLDEEIHNGTFGITIAPNLYNVNFKSIS